MDRASIENYYLSLTVIKSMQKLGIINNIEFQKAESLIAKGVIVLSDLDEKEIVFKASNKKHQKLYDHYIEDFKQETIFCLRLKKNVLSNGMKPITTLVFKPTKDMPFWKLCTIGASDYLMPERDIGMWRRANQRNEYMMLINPKVEISQEKTEWLSLNSLLWATAEYAFNAKENIKSSMKKMPFSQAYDN